MKFEVVFWLAVLAAYLLQAVASKKKRDAKKNLPAPPPGAEESSGSDFQSALAEISRMLQGETEPSGPDLTIPLPHHVEATSDSAPSRPHSPVRLNAPARAKPGSNTGLIEKHDFRKHTPEPGTFYDEGFEKRTTDTFHAPEIVHDHDYDYSGFGKESKEVKNELGSTVNKDLHDRAKTREAFVLSELLGPPLSKKKGSGYRYNP